MKLRVIEPRWLSPLSLALLVACGGGATGTTPLGEGSGDPVFGEGAGNPPFGNGSGGGLSGDGPRPNPDPAVVVSNDDIQGTVFDARSGSSLASASVQFSGTTLTTLTDGTYSQADATPDPRLVLQASASNHETLYTPTEVLGTVPAVNQLGLTPYGTASDITVAAGGTVTDTGSTASVTLPADALAAVGGGPAPAVVGVRVTPIAVGSDPHLLSGDYTDDNGGRLESFGGVILGSSVPVDVAIGQQLTLRIPVSTRSTVPPLTASLYRFEPSSGAWVDQGPVSITSGTYNADVDAFGQYMVGLPIASPITITGCVVEDGGAPAANVRMEIEGISYSGTAQATTDGTGASQSAVAAVEPHRRLRPPRRLPHQLGGP